MPDKIDIRQLSLTQLTEKLTALGEKPFRAKTSARVVVEKKSYKL